MSFYQKSREKIFHIISRAFPDAEALRHNGRIEKEALPSHLLWMIKEMEGWDITSVKRAAKAGRWIGWMFRAMEELDLFTNEDSRGLSKEDADSGYNLPH